MTDDSSVIPLDFVNDSSDASYDEHLELLDAIYEGFKEGLSKEAREMSIDVSLGDSLFQIRLNDFFVSLLLLFSRMPLREENVDKIYIVDESDFIHNVSNINGTIGNYYTTTLHKFEDNTSIETINRRIGYSLELIAKYTWNINYYKGNTVNLYDIFKFMEEVPEVKDIMNFQVDEHQQFSEIEDSITKRTNELISLIKDKSGDNYLNAMVDSVSKGQFQQVFVNVGLKPDLYENIIPKPINTSIMRGFRNSTDFYINAVGARKALITNASKCIVTGKQIGRAHV